LRVRTCMLVLPRRLLAQQLQLQLRRLCLRLHRFPLPQPRLLLPLLQCLQQRLQLHQHPPLTSSPCVVAASARRPRRWRRRPLLHSGSPPPSRLCRRMAATQRRRRSRLACSRLRVAPAPAWHRSAAPTSWRLRLPRPPRLLLRARSSELQARLQHRAATALAQQHHKIEEEQEATATAAAAPAAALPLALSPPLRVVARPVLASR
jgi:hypothetical protein